MPRSPCINRARVWHAAALTRRPSKESLGARAVLHQASSSFGPRSPNLSRQGSEAWRRVSAHTHPPPPPRRAPDYRVSLTLPPARSIARFEALRAFGSP